MRFLLPHATGPSGGHIYNRKMIDGPLPGDSSLQAVYAGPDDPAETLMPYLPSDPGGWILWDSLLLHRIAEVAALCKAQRHALLVHYLPSRNPLKAPTERARLRSEEDLAASSVEAFIVTGLGVASELRERYPGKAVFLCEPGVDPAFSAVRARRSRVQAGSLNLLTVANPVPGKGYASLLAVLHKLSNLGWRWHLVGDPEVDPAFLGQWLEEVGRSGLGTRIHFRGTLAQEELVETYGDMDLFLAASQCESYGMALAEAVAAGLPVITTRVGEAERLVEDGVNGYVVDFGDWPRYQRLLQRMLEDPELRTGMSLALPAEPVRTWQQTREAFAGACRSIQALPFPETKA